MHTMTREETCAARDRLISLSDLPRYRFGEFTLSPRQRTLLRNGLELRLIPRYFDLLVLLVQRRNEAVHRRDIFDTVWSDVIVSDSALSQAIRTLRRTLGDDSREPVFIRTVARHGYRFVFSGVIEDEDGSALAAETAPSDPEQSPPADADLLPLDPFEPLLQRLTTAGENEEEQRDAAERLHGLGTAEALGRLGTRPGYAYARALLRDTRWDVASAGPVPLLSAPGGLQATVELIRLRLRRAARFVAERGLGATLGSGLAGAIAGGVGGVLLALAPGSDAPLPLAGVLAVIGACCAAIGGAGVAGGLSLGEAIARSHRLAGVIAGSAAGGCLVGCAAQWFLRWSLPTLVGLSLETGGCVEGAVIGAAAGLGYAAATRHVESGLAAPRGRHRLAATAFTGAACALAGLALSASGRMLVGGTIHAVAQASAGHHALLGPLARLMGEPDLGPWTRAVIGAGEAGLFGLGLALGLTSRPRSINF
jgi:DNA-binding winged helix-turn-helix (wHTH) protein